MKIINSAHGIFLPWQKNYSNHYFFGLLRRKLLAITHLLLLLFFTTLAFAKEVNIYIWAGYLPTSVIEQFTKETGIKINLAEFDSNETLFAKLKTSPKAGYDIIVPSSYYVDRMQRQGMLYKIDKNRLSNFKYLNPAFLHKPFDPNNDFSIPYIWGSTGIVINKKYFDSKTINKWSDFWEPRFADQLMVLDDMQEAFSMALITLGYSINDRDPKHIYEAYLKLNSLMPNIKIFTSDSEKNIYIDEDVSVGMGWSGDIFDARQENNDLEYIYPADGFVIWLDCLAIAKNAPHVEQAYALINFILRPDIAKQISLETGYSLPNSAAVKLLPKDMQNDPIANPEAKVIAKGQFQQDLGDSVELYAKYWDALKTGGTIKEMIK